WSQADGALARAHDEQAEFVATLPERIALCCVGQIKSQHQAAPARSGYERITFRQVLQSRQERLALGSSMQNELLLLDDSKIMSGADVIGEIAAPRGTDPARQPEAIVFHFIEARPGHHTADLRFLSEHQQVGANVKMLTAPVLAGDAHAGL